jgi:membrane protease YdiL (CAAX protease family)
MSARQTFLRQALILWTAGLIGVVAVLPMVVHLKPTILDQAAAKGVSLPLLVGLTLLQNGLFLAVAVVVGLWAARRLSQRAPLSEALATDRNLREATGPFLWTAILAGVVTGTGLWLLSAFVFGPSMPGEYWAIRRGLTWQGLPTALYGGITEELYFRLFLLSLLGLAARRLLAPGATGLPAVPFWVTNCVAALFFGLGHIFNAFAGVPLTPVVWAYALVLNGVCGLVFGWLYWRKGLEAAMVAHFLVDIVLHVIGPLLERL